MPDAYVYGLMSVVDDECGSDAERVVIMTPIVTRITDMICTRVYLANEINISKMTKRLESQNLTISPTDKSSEKKHTYLLFDTNHPMNMLIINPPLLNII